MSRVVIVLSVKPVAQKLFIKEGFRVLLVNEPSGYRAKLGNLPLDVIIVTKPENRPDFIQVFVTSEEQLVKELGKLRAILTPTVLLWVTYPKGTSKVKTDINRDTIREYAATLGLQAIAMVSVDDTWSALRLKTA